MFKVVRAFVLLLLTLLLLVLIWRHGEDLLILACEKLGWQRLLGLLNDPGCFGSYGEILQP